MRRGERLTLGVGVGAGLVSPRLVSRYAPALGNSYCYSQVPSRREAPGPDPAPVSWCP